MSKLIKKAGLKQRSGHIDANNLYAPSQSACRRQHNTETALIKIQNYIPLSLDNSKTVLLILLDPSTVFDSINHNILLTCVESRIGVTDTALEWCRSYLSDWSQVIYLDGVSSNSCLLLYGVPQECVACKAF